MGYCDQIYNYKKKYKNEGVKGCDQQFWRDNNVNVSDKFTDIYLIYNAIVKHTAKRRYRAPWETINVKDGEVKRSNVEDNVIEDISKRRSKSEREE